MINKESEGEGSIKEVQEKTQNLTFLDNNSYDVSRFTVMENFELKDNEVILDLKKVNIANEKGTRTDYFCVSTTILNPNHGENINYKARIILFEILHSLEKITEVNEKRCASVVDCCRGLLVSSTEGPEMSAHTLGFKIQLYNFCRQRKKTLSSNPTEPTKIMATTINIIDDLILFADIRKGFNVMSVQDQDNSTHPTIVRAYECYNDITVTATELWNVTNNVLANRADCIAVIATHNNLLQIYESSYNTMQLKSEINIGRRVTCVKKIENTKDSENIVYLTQQGSIGLLSKMNYRAEKLSEDILFNLNCKYFSITIIFF